MSHADDLTEVHAGTPCSFVPGYLLRRLAEAETAVTAESENTLRLDSRLRAQRESSATTSRPVEAVQEGKRVIHDAQGAEILPGIVARRDDDPPTGDAGVDEAHTSSGQAYDLLETVFGRRSYDGNGTTVSVTVHYGANYDNAFWDGQQLVFGDGDGQIFERFTKPMDVMAHGFAHGVVQFTAALEYRGQSGALNESVADVFAALTKQWVADETADAADWLIGEGLFRPGVQATALRSMLEPGTAYDDPRLGKDPQVGSMADYVETDEDNGGVHLNSGIPNRAFALAALALGGRSWERAGRVWYDALTAGEVTATADFATFARATMASAGRLFPDDPGVGRQVLTAWNTVGLIAEAVAVGSTPSGGSESRPEVGHEPAPADPTRVAVRRTGGFAGMVTRGELDLNADPDGPEVRMLLHRVDLQQISVSSPVPDRFVYTVEYGEVRVSVPEQDLTPELSRVVHIVLGRSVMDLG